MFKKYIFVSERSEQLRMIIHWFNTLLLMFDQIILIKKKNYNQKIEVR